MKLSSNSVCFLLGDTKDIGIFFYLFVILATVLFIGILKIHQNYEDNFMFDSLKRTQMFNLKFLSILALKYLQNM